MIAAANGKVEVVKELLKYDNMERNLVDVNEETAIYKSVIMKVSRGGKSEEQRRAKRAIAAAERHAVVFNCHSTLFFARCSLSLLSSQHVDVFMEVRMSND